MNFNSLLRFNPPFFDTISTNAGAFLKPGKRTAMLVFFLFLSRQFIHAQTAIFDVAGGGTLPSGWVGNNNVTTSAISQTGYFLLESGTTSDNITTSSYDLTGYQSAVFTVNYAINGTTGTIFALSIQVSYDGGTTYTQLNITDLPASTTVYQSSGPVTLNSAFTNNVKIRIANNGTAAGRGIKLQAIKLTGYSKGWQTGGNQETALKNFGTANNFDLPFITNNTEKLRITSAGNVGIGVTAPAEKLEVSGNVKFSGALISGNSAGNIGQVLTSAGSGAAPVWLSPSGGSGTGWNLTGNTGTAPGTNFIGTTDDQDLVIKRNSIERMSFNGIGFDIKNQYASSVINYNSLTEKTTFGSEIRTSNNYGVNVNGVIALGANGYIGGSNRTSTRIGNFDDWVLTYQATGEHAVGGLTAHKFTVAVPLTSAGCNIATFDNGGAPFLTINKDGYVGIGTAAPSHQLHLYGTNPSVFLEGDANSYYTNINLKSVTGSGLINNYGPLSWRSGLWLNTFSAANLPVGIGATGLGAAAVSLDPGIVPFTVLGAQGQTEDLFHVINNTSTTPGNVGVGNVFSVSSNGTVKFSGALMPNSFAGTAGQVLTSSGPGAAPVWAAPPGGGGGTSQWITSGNYIYYDNPGNVSVGTSTLFSNFKITAMGGPGLGGLLVSGGSSEGHNNASGQIKLGHTTDYASILYEGTNGELIFSNHYDNANGNILFKTRRNGSGITAMKISGDGNIGIGTTAPVSKLHIVGNSGVSVVNPATGASESSVITVGNNLAGDESMSLYYGNSGNNVFGSLTANLLANGGTTGGMNISVAANAPINLRTNNITRMSVSGNGDVGIGVTAPRTKLDVAGAIIAGGDKSAYTVLQTDNDNFPSVNTNMNGLKLGAGGAEAVFITPSGRAGMGTHTPEFNFHVKENNPAITGMLLENTNAGSPGAYSAFVLYNNLGASSRAGLAKNSSLNTAYAGNNSLNLIQNANEPIGFVTSNSLRAIITGAGDVGIGTNSPKAKLDVNGTVAIGSVSSFPATGNYKLAVAGDIIAEKVKVRLQSSGWPDYVFQPSYQLPSLKYVENFIKANSHLPEVPSADDVQKNGIDLGDNQSVLLKKIEELTLYIIEQNKKAEQQQQQMDQLQQQLTELKKLLPKK